MNDDSITVVSGLPRSGTSMMMRMLEAGGLEVATDQVRQSDIDNPRGYYEFEKVKTIREDTSWLPEMRGKAFKMVVALVPYLAPVYRYRVVLMRRKMGEILASQEKMLQRLGKGGGRAGDERLGLLFEKQVRAVEEWAARQPNVTLLTVHYHDVLHDAARESARVAEFLGRPLDVARMASVVEHDLYRNRDRGADTARSAGA